MVRNVWLAVLALLVSALPACSGGDLELDEEDEDAVDVDTSEDELTVNQRRKRAEKMYADPVIARMYQTGHDAVAGRSPEQVAAALSSRKPSAVSGLIRIDSGDLGKNAAAFAAFKAVRASMKGVSFDVVLNPCQYRSSASLTKRMGEINAALGADKPEAWFFDFYDAPISTRERECGARGPNAKIMLKKVAAWAHKQNQLIGGNVWQSANLPAGADVLSVPDETGIAHVMEVVNRLPNNVVRLTHIENNPQKCWKDDLDDPRNPTKARCRDSSGEKYIWRLSPEQRKDYDADLAAASRRGNARAMKPVFFPLSYHLAGGASQAFDRTANAPASELPYVAGP